MLYALMTAMSLTATDPGRGAPAAVPSHDAVSMPLIRALRRDRPGIRLWTTGDDVYRRGDRARVYFRTERDAYVTIFRADTDGRVRVLYPRDPWEENFVRGGATYTVSSYRRGEAFLVDDDAGVGYVFGVASQDPFVYDPVVSGERWDLRQVADRVHGDPFSGMMDIADHLMPEGYEDYDTHLLPYYVERRYDYPRFVCYDCHTYVGFTAWNPYLYSCRRYSLYVFSDPYYFYPSYWYPTRYYGGTRVVYVRPRGSSAIGRYVFKDRTQPSQPAVIYRRRTDDRTQAVADRGVRGRDIGGVGSVGIPGVAPGRRTTDASGREPSLPPPNPPIIRGEGRRAADQGLTPGTRNDPPVRADQPTQGGGRRTAEPATPDRQPAPDGRAGTQDGRGVAVPSRQPEARRPSEERDEPGRAVARPAPRADSPPETRRPERQEPAAKPAARQEPRAEPRSAPPPRAAPAPRAEPQRSSPPRSEPSPRLERRRPDN